MTRVAAPIGLSCLLACGGQDGAAPARPGNVPQRVEVVPSAPQSALSPAPVASATAGSPRPPTRRVLVQGPRFDNPTAIAVDDTTVYVSSAGTVLAVPKAGGDPKEVFLKSTLADALILEGPYLYASAQLSDHVGNDIGGIVRLDKATQEVTVLAKHKMPGPMAMDDATIWYGALDQRAWRIPKAGGKPVGVPGVFGDVHAIAVDADKVYFAATRYGTNQKSTVYAAPRKGGGPATVIMEAGLTDAMSLAIVGGDLFFNDNGRVAVRSLASGETKVISGPGSAIALAPTSRGIFWCAIDMAGAAAHVGVFDLTKREARILATEPAPVGVAADAGAVYWADAQTRELVALVVTPQ